MRAFRTLFSVQFAMILFTSRGIVDKMLLLLQLAQVSALWFLHCHVASLCCVDQSNKFPVDFAQLYPQVFVIGPTSFIDCSSLWIT